MRAQSRRVADMSARIRLIRLATAGLAVLVLAAAAVATAQQRPRKADAETAMDAGRIDWLIHLVRQDCGSCHGLTLNGGLGPALTQEALQGKPQRYLEYVILQGIPGTAMPGWRPMVTDAEAAWIASQLMQGFPQE